MCDVPCVDGRLCTYWQTLICVCVSSTVKQKHHISTHIFHFFLFSLIVAFLAELQILFAYVYRLVCVQNFMTYVIGANILRIFYIHVLVNRRRRQRRRRRWDKKRRRRRRRSDRRKRKKKLTAEPSSDRISQHYMTNTRHIINFL